MIHCLVIKNSFNEDWQNYTCIESCAAIGNARHGCESLGTDIQSIREIDDSGCMLTNITGSSILKSTDHTSQVKPGKLSVRFILNDREPCSVDLHQTVLSQKFFQQMNLRLV